VLAYETGGQVKRWTDDNPWRRSANAWKKTMETMRTRRTLMQLLAIPVVCEHRNGLTTSGSGRR
jgi:hypothetical protein